MLLIPGRLAVGEEVGCITESVTGACAIHTVLMRVQKRVFGAHLSVNVRGSKPAENFYKNLFEPNRGYDWK